MSERKEGDELIAFTFEVTPAEAEACAKYLARCSPLDYHAPFANLREETLVLSAMEKMRAAAAAALGTPR